MIYRKEIDGLRAIAVLAVILFHAGFSFIKGGFIGVDIFFVISGFLMTSIIISETEAGIFTLKRFYERRIRRIFPMLFFVILICFIPAFWHLVDLDLIAFSTSAVRASIAISNIFFAKTTLGYFDTSTDLIPLVHTWTLGVEEQFYIIIPLIFILLWKFGKTKILHFIILLALASFILMFLQTDTIKKFYLLQFRFWELAIGSIIAFIPKQKKSEILTGGGLITILLSIFLLNEKMPNISELMLLPTIGTALVIIYGQGSFTFKILSFKPLTWIGLISYSAYLIHQPLFSFARITTLEQVNTLQFASLILITFILAFITWKFVENPFRDKKKISFFTIVSISILLVIAFQIGERIIKYNKGFPARFMNEELANSFNWAKNEPQEKCLINHNKGSFKTKPIFCNIGINAEKSPPTYILTGTSMALAITPIFNKSSGSGLFTALGWCKFLLSENYKNKDYLQATPSGFPCNRLPSAVYDYAKQHSNIKTVYIAGDWTHVNDPSKKAVLNNLVANLDLMKDVEYTISQYTAIGVHLVFIQNPIFLEEDPRKMYGSLIKQNALTNESIQKLSITEMQAKEHYEYWYKIIDKYKNNPNVSFVNIEDLLCTKEACPIGNMQHSYYADKMHLSYDGIQLIENRIKQAIEN